MEWPATGLKLAPFAEAVVRGLRLKGVFTHFSPGSGRYGLCYHGSKSSFFWHNDVSEAY